MAADPHILRRLRLPARYEGLVAAVGPDVVRVLVEPAQGTIDSFRSVGLAIPARAEGLFVPISADSGTGKTTLAQNLSSFLGEYFVPTALHQQEVSVAALEATVSSALAQLPANDARVVPLLVDDRESNPATDAELAAMKQFLRRSGTGSRSLIIWPETSESIAGDMARRYIAVAGDPPIHLPLLVLGPATATWRGVAEATLRLVNGLTSLDELGVDPDDYDPAEFPSLGAFLRRISDDFTRLVNDLLTATELPVSLVVLIASVSSDAGVLSQLTSGTEFGLLDPHALVDATPDSVIGRWWNDRRSLLTQLIVRMDARAFCAPPSVVVPVLRRYADPVFKAPLEALVALRSEAELVRTFSRSDVGRFAAGEIRAAYESRGTPATTSESAFELLAEQVGFSAGRDKLANRGLAELLGAPALCEANDWTGVSPEEKLPFAPIIPDIRIDRPGSYLCLELTWRKGEFLGSASRSAVAQYLLGKVQNYGRELGWITD